LHHLQPFLFTCLLVHWQVFIFSGWRNAVKFYGLQCLSYDVSCISLSWMQNFEEQLAHWTRPFHIVPNSKSQNLVIISVHFFLHDYLYWAYWTNFVACVTIPVISPILVFCSMLIPQDMNQSEALFSICRSLTKFLRPKKRWRKLYIYSPIVLSTSLKEMDEGGIGYLLGPEF
jgi:hypothetical protein